MTTRLNKHIFYKFSFVLLGLSMVCYYLWFRFFRERLPRNLPFSLTWISFLFLVIICVSYSYIIYKLLKQHQHQSYFISKMLIKLNPLFTVLFKPFLVLHNFFFVDLNLDYFLIDFFSPLIKKYKLYDYKINLYLSIILDFFPKAIILLFFLFDVFYFKKLSNFYYLLILGLIPLSYTYFIYSCTTSLERLVKYLDENYSVKILTTEEEEKAYEDDEKTIGPAFMVRLYNLKENDYGLLDSSYFIEIQALNLMFDYYLYRYTCVETAEAREAYAEKHNLELPFWVLEPESDYISKQLAPYFFANIEKAIYLEVFLEEYKDISKVIINKKYLIMILIGYVIGWTYILIISLHTLKDIPLTLKILELMKEYSEIEEPFSQIILEKLKNYDYNVIK